MDWRCRCRQAGCGDCVYVDRTEWMYGLGDYARHATASMSSAGDRPFFLTVKYPDTYWPFQDQVQGRPQDPVAPEDVAVMPFVGVDNPRILRTAAKLVWRDISPYAGVFSLSPTYRTRKARRVLLLQPLSSS